MKRSGIWAIGIATFVSAGSLAVEQAYSSDQGGPTSCSNATLKGIYMFANSGFQSVSPSLVPLGVTGKDVFMETGSSTAWRP
jgi:hypothetical protein